jgi:hypothetical protein
VLPFENCDTLKDNKLIESELENCLAKDINLSYVKSIKDTKFIFSKLDQLDYITFYDYIYLRRVDLAMKNCSINDIISPVIL